MVAEARRRLQLPAQQTSGRAALRTRLASVEWPYIEATIDSPYIDPATLVQVGEKTVAEKTTASKL